MHHNQDHNVMGKKQVLSVKVVFSFVLIVFIGLFNSLCTWRIGCYPVNCYKTTLMLVKSLKAFLII